jgi:hypothetical protein
MTWRAISAMALGYGAGVARGRGCGYRRVAAVVGRCKLKPIETCLESAWFLRMKVNCDELVANFAFHVKLRNYAVEPRAVARARRAGQGHDAAAAALLHAELQVGRCRLTVSKSMLKAPVASALESHKLLSTLAFNFNLRRFIQGGVPAPRRGEDACAVGARRQGLILVHFSAQRKRFLWDRGCMDGSFRRC